MSIKISGLDDAVQLDGTEYFPLVKNGTTKKAKLNFPIFSERIGVGVTLANFKQMSGYDVISDMRRDVDASVLSCLRNLSNGGSSSAVFMAWSDAARMDYVVTSTGFNLYQDSLIAPRQAILVGNGVASMLFGIETGNADLIFIVGGNTATEERMRIRFDGRIQIGQQFTGDASSILHIHSTTKGFITPRMTTTQRDAISTPAEGLEIYNLTSHAKEFFNGSVWKTITTN